jgi:hypothetical protein
MPMNGRVLAEKPGAMRIQIDDASAWLELGRHGCWGWGLLGSISHSAFE